MSARKLLGVLLLAAAVGGGVRADTVYLKTGEELSGTVVEDSALTILLKQPNGTLISVRKKDVDTIVYDRRVTPGAAANAAAASAEAARANTLVSPAESPAGRGSKIPPTAEKEAEKPAALPAVPAAKETKGADGKLKPEKDVPADKGAEKTGAAAAPAAAGPAAAAAEMREPLNLAGFPEKAKRMTAAKEKIFLDALERLTSDKDDVRQAAEDDITALGGDAIPYLIAGIQHSSVFARTACMDLIGKLNGRNAIKAVIEVFYAAMPEKDEPATYQVPFIQAIKTTLPKLTGQTFINCEARSVLVQEGLKKYIDWYNANYDRLPRQAGEPELAPTDPEFMQKLKALRELKLVRRDWPRPPMPADLVGYPNPSSAQQPNYPPALPVTGGVPGERKADAKYVESIPTVNRTDALSRPQDKKGY